MQNCSGFAIAVECVPCRSTFQICKEANRFLKLPLIRSFTNFALFSEAVWNRLDVEDLFSKTDFSHNTEHKTYFIRSIVDVYIQIKGTRLAKIATQEMHQDSLRSKLKKIKYMLRQSSIGDS